MSKTPAASLLVSTYEMPRHLELVLAALERQTETDCEVFLCDDGSGPDTEALIRGFQARAPFPVRHLWQENQGFRKCRILNRALREATGRIVVFLDGDCIPHREYIRDHLTMTEPGRYLAGRRVMLGPELSDWLTADRVRAGFFDRPRIPLLMSSLKGETKHILRSWRVSWGPLRARLRMNRVDDLLGCNYSVSREALVAINGFDEAYEGYGREDTDAEVRLQNLGLKIKSIKGMALQFHVWHPRREFTPANDTRLEELKRERRVRCERGLEGAGA